MSFAKSAVCNVVNSKSWVLKILGDKILGVMVNAIPELPLFYEISFVIMLWDE